MINWKGPKWALAPILMIGGCTAIAAPAPAPQEVSTQQVETEPSRYAAQIEAFRAYLKEYRRENLVLSLSVAVVKDGEILMVESLGWQDHDAEEPTPLKHPT